MKIGCSISFQGVITDILVRYMEIQGGNTGPGSSDPPKTQFRRIRYYLARCGLYALSMGDILRRE